MIHEFRIISISEKGKDVLQSNLSEWNKLPPHAKLMWKALFTREVKENPLTWVVKVKNSSLAVYLEPRDLIKKLEKSMNDGGCKKNIDYKIEVKNK